jgi:hypothetical protein
VAAAAVFKKWRRVIIGIPSLRLLVVCMPCNVPSGQGFAHHDEVRVPIPVTSIPQMQKGPDVSIGAQY